MAEMINFGPMLPYMVEVTIIDLPKILRAEHLAGSKIRLPFLDGKELLQRDFDYRFGPVGGILPEPEFGLAIHNMRSTAVEVVVANEIYNRIGEFVRDALNAAIISVFALESGALPEGRISVDAKSGELFAEPGYLEGLFDLSQPRFEDASYFSMFDVAEISLESPARTNNAIVGIFLQFNVAVAGVPAAGTAAPATLATSQVSQFITAMGAGAAGAFATIGTKTGYEIIIRHANEREIEQKIEGRISYYELRLEHGDCTPIQNDLWLLGLYDGKIDNKFGPNSKEARRLFALRHNLPPDISHKDAAFLRALAAVTIRGGFINPITAPSR